MNSYVCGFLRSANHLLLIKKQKKSDHWQNGMYNGLGGSIEPNESAPEAMVREFKEEAGVQTTEDDWKLKLVLGCEEKWRVYFYTALGNHFIPPDCEEGKLEWHEITTLPLNTIPNLKWIIPMCFDSTILFPVFVRDSK